MAGVGRPAEGCLEVAILDDERPAGSYRVPHRTQHVDRAAQVLQHVAAVHDVVRIRLRPVVHVGLHEPDVREALLGGGLAGQVELDAVHVHPDDQAARSDPPAQHQRDVAAAGAEVDAVLAVADADPVEQRLGGGQPGAREHREPRRPRRTAADDVLLSVLHSGDSRAARRSRTGRRRASRGDVRALPSSPSPAGRPTRACGRTRSRASGCRNRCRVIALGRVNSRSPSAPWMRPKPESPTPPNGSAGTVANATAEFTEVMPVRSRRASSIAARLREDRRPQPVRRRVGPVHAPRRRRAPGPPSASGRTSPRSSPATSSGTSTSSTGSTYGALHRLARRRPLRGRRGPARPCTCAADRRPTWLRQGDRAVRRRRRRCPAAGPGAGRPGGGRSRRSTASTAYTRSMPTQVCPALPRPPQAAASAAASRSASSSTMSASLPPHSMQHRASASPRTPP